MSINQEIKSLRRCYQRVKWRAQDLLSVITGLEDERLQLEIAEASKRLTKISEQLERCSRIVKENAEILGGTHGSTTDESRA